MRTSIIYIYIIYIYIYIYIYRYIYIYIYIWCHYIHRNVQKWIYLSDIYMFIPKALGLLAYPPEVVLYLLVCHEKILSYINLLDRTIIHLSSINKMSLLWFIKCIFSQWYLDIMTSFHLEMKANIMVVLMNVCTCIKLALSNHVFNDEKQL